MGIEEKNSSGSTAFTGIFKAIVEGQVSLGGIADRGASHALLSTGMMMLIASIALKYVVVIEGALSSKVQLSTGDLAILLASSLGLLFVGSGLRVWDRHLVDKASEREVRLRLEAAGQAAAILAGAVPTPLSPQPVNPI